MIHHPGLKEEDEARCRNVTIIEPIADFIQNHEKIRRYSPKVNIYVMDHARESLISVIGILKQRLVVTVYAVLVLDDVGQDPEEVIWNIAALFRRREVEFDG